jgi:hypothetical protein
MKKQNTMVTVYTNPGVVQAKYGACVIRTQPAIIFIGSTSELGSQFGIGLNMGERTQVFAVTRIMDVVRFWRMLSLMQDTIEREFMDLSALQYHVWMCWRVTAHDTGESHIHHVGISADAWNVLMTDYPDKHWYHRIISLCKGLHVPYLEDSSFAPGVQKQLALVCK